MSLCLQKIFFFFFCDKDYGAEYFGGGPLSADNGAEKKAQLYTIFIQGDFIS